MAEKIKLLDIFPSCSILISQCQDIEICEISEVEIIEELNIMTIEAHFLKIQAPADISRIESHIKELYALNDVKLKANYPAPKIEKQEIVAGAIFYGKEIGAKRNKIVDLDATSGSVIIEGDVCAVDNREIARRGAHVLNFDITDSTSTIRVSKFLSMNDDKSILDKVKVGQRLIVAGDMSYNKFDDDIQIEPKSIVLGEKEFRQDTYPEKRVELHLHTRFSSQDAICEPVEVVKRAAAWGHKAVAVTDHGVAQAFPDMWKTAKKLDVKVIYGIEGYYINDVDAGKAVNRYCELDIDTEFVAFDIETTGLSARNDRMTEIGAVVMKNGEIIEKFSTFVNPHMKIPVEITELTGIRDSDVKDAPDEDVAMRMFLDFVKDRPLIAHNASFDTGFMAMACERHDIDFEPVVADTLYMAQCLLTKLKKHRLNVVSEHLGLPAFNHHRAFEDAAVVARIIEKFIPMLKERGVTKLCEIDPALAATAGTKFKRSKHICILVKDKVGLKNLYKLISNSYIQNFNKFPIILRSDIEKHREGLLIGSACEAGELFDAILNGESKARIKKIADFYDYLEIMPLANNQFLVEKGMVKDREGLIELNKKIIKLGHDLHKPVVATGDVHFMEPEEEVYRRILLSAKKFSDVDKPMPLYFRTTDDMMEEFSYLGEKLCHEVVIKNPNLIADMCEKIELLPKKLFPPRIENSDGQLKDLVYGKMQDIYGENPPDIVKNRVETELTDILNANYDVIYMSAQKLVEDSNKNGYLVGSRGSVGSSIVAFMSGITEVNSLPAHYVCPSCKNADFKSGEGFGCGADMPDALCPNCGTKYNKDGFDIPFETFLGFGGGKVPDIDLNFSGEYQARAHKYTEELFGSDHVFRAGTISTLAEKTAYGYVKKYMEERGIEASKAEENRLARGLVGVKRTTGQHPGGLVVIPDDMEIEDFCPVQHPADDPERGIITTHFEYHCMEDNLLKLDELGHDDPTMLKYLGDLTGIDVQKIPLDDPETMRIFKSAAPLKVATNDPIIGKTGSIGIPEFGTGFTRQMLIDTQPEAFATLVQLSGFSHGTDVWLGNAKDLIMSGTATVNQTIACRDDIMLYLISCGIDEKRAFKIMELVRKGKGLPEGADEEMRKAGVPEWYIESCNKIKYLFPKAHAVAYVMMAFRIAYFKVHHPLAFYSAYFYRRSQKDSFDAGIMTQGQKAVLAKINEIDKAEKTSAKEEDLRTTLEAVYEFYERGFSFAPISLGDSDATRFLLVGDNMLRAPFISISGLGATAANDLMACRSRAHEFISIEELSAACPKVSQTSLEALKNMGALGDMPEESQMSLF